MILLKRLFLALITIGCALLGTKAKADSDLVSARFNDEIIAMSPFRGDVIVGTASKRLLLLDTNCKILKSVALATKPWKVVADDANILVWDSECLSILDMDFRVTRRIPFDPPPMTIENGVCIAVLDAWDYGPSYLCAVDLEGRELWRWDADSGGESIYVLYDLSPSGNSIVMYNGSQLFVIGASGKTWASFAVGGEVGSIGLSSDGSKAAVCQLSRLRIFDVGTQKVSVELPMSACVKGSVRDGFFYVWDKGRFMTLSCAGKASWILQERVDCISESTTGQFVAITLKGAPENGIVKIVRTKDGGIYKQKPVKGSLIPWGMRWMPDGGKLILAMEHELIVIDASKPQ